MLYIKLVKARVTSNLQKKEKNARIVTITGSTTIRGVLDFWQLFSADKHQIRKIRTTNDMRN